MILRESSRPLVRRRRCAEVVVVVVVGVAVMSRRTLCSPKPPALVPMIMPGTSPSSTTPTGIPSAAAPVTVSDPTPSARAPPGRRRLRRARGARSARDDRRHGIPHRLGDLRAAAVPARGSRISGGRTRRIDDASALTTAPRRRSVALPSVMSSRVRSTTIVPGRSASAVACARATSWREVTCTR